MSRTYRYPRESLDEPMTRDEPVADFRIRRKLEKQKHRKKMGLKWIDHLKCLSVLGINKDQECKSVYPWT